MYIIYPYNSKANTVGTNNPVYPDVLAYPANCELSNSIGVCGNENPIQYPLDTFPSCLAKFTNHGRYATACTIPIETIKIIPFFNTFANIIFLDVSQGDSMLYITKNQSKVYMFDTGGIRNRSVSDNSLMYLKSLGISKIDYLILTHGDYDHMGASYELIKSYNVGKIIINSYEDNQKL